MLQLRTVPRCGLGAGSPFLVALRRLCLRWSGARAERDIWIVPLNWLVSPEASWLGRWPSFHLPDLVYLPIDPRPCRCSWGRRQENARPVHSARIPCATKTLRLRRWALRSRSWRERLNEPDRSAESRTVAIQPVPDAVPDVRLRPRKSAYRRVGSAIVRYATPATKRPSKYRQAHWRRVWRTTRWWANLLSRPSLAPPNGSPHTRLVD